MINHVFIYSNLLSSVSPIIEMSVNKNMLVCYSVFNLLLCL